MISQVLHNSWALIGLAAICGLGVLATRIFLRRTAHQRAMMQKARLFRERVSSFKNHAQTLDEHSNEYAAVFQGDEWHQLVEMLNQLEAIDGEIHDLLARRQYGEARSLLSRVCRESAAEQQWTAEEAQDQLEALIDWEHSVHGMLRNVVRNLEIATEHTRQVANPSAPRTKKRQPTLVTLADLKKSLIESGEFN